MDEESNLEALLEPFRIAGETGFWTMSAEEEAAWLAEAQESADE